MRTAFAGLGVALVLSMGSAPAWAADLTMRISLQLPLKSHLGQNLALFKEEVEKASDGSIEIEEIRPFHQCVFAGPMVLARWRAFTRWPT